MSQTECPMCIEAVPAGTTVCPHCGSLMDPSAGAGGASGPMSSHGSALRDPEPVRLSKRSRAVVIVVCLWGILGVLSIVFLITNQWSSSTSAPLATTVNENPARIDAQTRSAARALTRGGVAGTARQSVTLFGPPGDCGGYSVALANLLESKEFSYPSARAGYVNLMVGRGWSASHASTIFDAQYTELLAIVGPEVRLMASDAGRAYLATLAR